MCKELIRAITLSLGTLVAGYQNNYLNIFDKIVFDIYFYFLLHCSKSSIFFPSLRFSILKTL